MLTTGVLVTGTLALTLASGPANVSSIPVGTVYDPTTAMRAAHLSATAYCDADLIQDWTCEWCKANTEIFVGEVKVFEDAGTDTQGFVAYSDDPTMGIVVSFRGTRSVNNWIHNLMLAKTKAYPLCDGCLVHVCVLL